MTNLGDGIHKSSLKLWNPESKIDSGTLGFGLWTINSHGAIGIHKKHCITFDELLN